MSIIIITIIAIVKTILTTIIEEYAVKAAYHQLPEARDIPRAGRGGAAYLIYPGNVILYDDLGFRV